MNILIVGLGSIAQKHIKAIKSLNLNATLFALRSTQDASSYEGVINIYNLENIEVLLDFVIISNPTFLHYKFIKKFAEKNIPLFIEKPVLQNLDNSLDLVQFVESNNLLTYTACNLRFHPCLIYLKDLINSNDDKVEEVNIYCGSYLPDWRPGKNYKDLYSANSKMGGGVHLDLFHEFDYTTWIFGMPKNSFSLKRNVSSLMIDAVDYANYNLEYKEFTANIVLNYYRKTPRRSIEIVMKNKILLVDLINNIISDEMNQILFSAPGYNILNTYFDQMQYFVNCLKLDQKPMNSLKESIEVLKIVLQNE